MRIDECLGHFSNSHSAATLGVKLDPELPDYLFSRRLLYFPHGNEACRHRGVPETTSPLD